MDLEAVVDKLVQAKDAGDWDTWRSLCAPTASFRLHPSPEMSIEELLGILIAQREAGSSFQYSNARRVIAPDALLEEHDVTFSAPGAEDRVVEACLIFRFEDGLISRIDEYMATPLA